MQSTMACLVAALSSVAMLPGCAATPASPAPSDGPMAAVAFMEGTWRSEHGATITEETWSLPRGGMMLGTALTVKDDRAVFFEFLRLESREQAVVYIAQPKGRTPTEFVLTESSGDRATFTNPTHDFPKRIMYERHGDRLKATVDGGPGASMPGGPPAQVFEMRRQPAP